MHWAKTIHIRLGKVHSIICYLFMRTIASILLHHCTLQIFIWWVIWRLFLAASWLPRGRRICVYLKNIWDDSWSDKRDRVPGNRPLRSGPSHAMLRARGGAAFWVTEFHGEGCGTIWETRFTVADGGVFEVLLWKWCNERERAVEVT